MISEARRETKITKSHALTFALNFVVILTIIVVIRDQKDRFRMIFMSFHDIFKRFSRGFHEVFGRSAGDLRKVFGTSLGLLGP